jgi:hypothetical protein
MILHDKIDWLSKLGNYMLGNDRAWEEAKHKASLENSWFTPEFINLSVENIVKNFLDHDKLVEWAAHYKLRLSGDDSDAGQQTVGIVMAGNIPLVGFHDLISVFVSGHKAAIKPSSKDSVLVKHLVTTLIDWAPQIGERIRFAEILRDCNSFIATGSNNTSRYFEYYFGKYPHIIRRNKTSVAILKGNEHTDELEKLADDVFQFFGLGCRNVTKIYVPGSYAFEQVLDAFTKYSYLASHQKYKNNYDYNLAIQILNNKLYMSNGSIVLTEDTSMFSPIGQLNYEYYADPASLSSSLSDNEELQCIIGEGHIPFGQSQCPSLFDYPDKVDTMTFLNSL